MQLPIYMDHHATTPVDARVLERMLPYFAEKFGNAASRSHSFGWQAEEAVEVARRQVASLIGADASEIVFCSGATEANNLALLGVATGYAERGDHIVTQVTEHKAVLDVCGALEKRGVGVTYVGVDKHGRVSVDEVAEAIGERTLLVSIMAANNEIGTLQPLAEIGALCEARGVLFHSDAAQAAGKVPLHVGEAKLSLVSLSAHKLYGPKGVGALYVRRKNPRVQLAAQIHGGGHERGRRSGTLNVPGIVGLGAACALAQEEGRAEAERLLHLREHLAKRLFAELEGVRLNGHPHERLPGNLNVSFAGVEAEALLLSLRDVALSSGAACTSTTLAPSHVLLATGLSAEAAQTSLRFGLGRQNTLDEVDYVATQVVEKVTKLRALAGFRGARKVAEGVR